MSSNEGGRLSVCIVTYKLDQYPYALENSPATGRHLYMARCNVILMKEELWASECECDELCRSWETQRALLLLLLLLVILKPSVHHHHLNCVLNVSSVLRHQRRFVKYSTRTSRLSTLPSWCLTWDQRYVNGTWNEVSWPGSDQSPIGTAEIIIIIIIIIIPGRYL